MFHFNLLLFRSLSRNRREGDSVISSFLGRHQPAMCKLLYHIEGLSPACVVLPVSSSPPSLSYPHHPTYHAPGSITLSGTPLLYLGGNPASPPVVDPSFAPSVAEILRSLGKTRKSEGGHVVHLLLVLADACISRVCTSRVLPRTASRGSPMAGTVVSKEPVSARPLPVK